MPHNIFLGIPHYGHLCQETVASILRASSRHKVHITFEGGSLLTFNFNNLWAKALNIRDQGLTHFAMLHADIGSTADWIDTLIEEMEARDADIISAIVPIKDGRGVTSSAIVNRDTGEIRRLTMHEVMLLPETFGEEVCQSNCFLAMNTGLWVARFRGDWVEKAAFNVRDEITKDANGRFEARVLSEDWNFSRWAAEIGLKIALTRKVVANHIGFAGYCNQSDWGLVRTERAWIRPESMVRVIDGRELEHAHGILAR